jgi:hypothetical protein
MATMKLSLYRFCFELRDSSHPQVQISLPMAGTTLRPEPRFGGEIVQKACHARAFAACAPGAKGDARVRCIPLQEALFPQMTELRKMLGFTLRLSTTYRRGFFRWIPAISNSSAKFRCSTYGDEHDLPSPFTSPKVPQILTTHSFTAHQMRATSMDHRKSNLSFQMLRRLNSEYWRRLKRENTCDSSIERQFSSSSQKDAGLP